MSEESAGNERVKGVKKVTVTERVKELMSQKDKWLKYVATAVCLLLLLRVCLNLAYILAAPYQTFKDCFYYKGIAVYVAASVNHFTAAAYQAELRNAMVSKCVAWGLFLIILVDVIRTGKRYVLAKRTDFFITVLAFSCALAMNFSFSVCLFCPFAALYLTPIGKRQWTWLVDCLTMAYYGAFVWIMAKCLIMVSHTGCVSGDDALWAMTIPAKLQSYVACGMPVIASAQGGTKRVIEEAGCGVCAPIGAAAALAAVKGMKDADLAVLGGRGREYFEKNFDKRKLMEQMEEYFRSVEGGFGKCA